MVEEKKEMQTCKSNFAEFNSPESNKRICKTNLPNTKEQKCHNTCMKMEWNICDNALSYNIS